MSSLLLLPPSSDQESIFIIVTKDQFKKLYPEESDKRTKEEFTVEIESGNNKISAVISPGGQSTLKSFTPNLRVSNSASKEKKNVIIAGVSALKGSLRINPMTMDDGYFATKFYMELLNQYGLTPQIESGLKIQSSYAHVYYVIKDLDLVEKMRGLSHLPKEFIVPSTKTSFIYSAGLHLITDNPKSLLKSAKSSTQNVVAVLRSRYNILNKKDSIKKRIPLHKHTAQKGIYTPEKSSTLPFRVELEWIDANKDSVKYNTLLDQATSMIERLYSLPKLFEGPTLLQEMDAILDVPQLFRFLAINNVIKNGDISDEYFWYLVYDNNTKQYRLGLMPQDGDDMFKGAHLFPFNGHQISLIIKDQIGANTGLIFNFEDPLFIAIAKDRALYKAYLLEYESLLKSMIQSSYDEAIFNTIKSQLYTYKNDNYVLSRGLHDERKKIYDSSDFENRIFHIQNLYQSSIEDTLSEVRKEMNTLHGPSNHNPSIYENILNWISF